MTISPDLIIDAEFSAPALLISFGALIGRATPSQMCAISIAEAVFYSINKVIIVFGLLKAKDGGGTIIIHMFGAYFGLPVRTSLDWCGPSVAEMDQNVSSNVSR